MAELKTKTTTQKVSDYIKSLPKERQAEGTKLNAIFKKISGKTGVVWSTGLVGYGEYHYKYSSGRGGDWFLMGFSSRKTNLTIYLMCGYGHYKELLKKLGKHKTGSSCLYIKSLSDVDEKILIKILSEGLKKMKEMKMQ